MDMEIIQEILQESNDCDLTELKSILIEEIKKLPPVNFEDPIEDVVSKTCVDPTRQCQARVWRGGLGGQCSYVHNETSDLCNKHCKMLSSQGTLWLGYIYDPAPERPIYYGPNGDQSVTKVWKGDLEN